MIKCNHSYLDQQPSGLLKCRACDLEAEQSYMVATKNRLAKDSLPIRSNCEHNTIADLGVNGVVCCVRCGEQWSSRLGYVLTKAVNQRLSKGDTVDVKRQRQDNDIKAKSQAAKHDMALWLMAKGITLKLS